ncbi:putative endonuclease [Natranaerovirga pectinivora]|uniref:UPF0102 protein EDC18_101282 n=1 Tax=Natranaerovirga pectinivora TaxID=682400 RepID=A0A4R3MUL6_9FIRM|nr:YraN family protein [Natranaerovirga pectinivora]TCT16986.1 putative endonuclease [Natranaerovirga pectinivora]
MKNNRKIGKEYEDKARRFLESLNYKILETNFRCKIGEIDIIGQDNDYLVFVEVKYRKNDKKGDPSEAVNYYKQRTINKVANYYLMKKGYGYHTASRFDVVVILDEDIRVIKNAFYSM